MSQAALQATPPENDPKAVARKIRRFVEERCIPREPDLRASDHYLTDDVRLDLIAEARAAGVYGPHLAAEHGGLDLDWKGRAEAFRAAGYSLIGPYALNCCAPDEGNHHLLEMIASPEQKERFLHPLVREAKRSCFMMSEPDGAGSDPTLLKTTAKRDGSDYVINGRKWYISGATGADVAIIMARDETADGAPSMFLTELPAPGVNIVREMQGLAHDAAGGHAEIELDNVRIPADQVLGAPGEGFRYAQVRLAPARLTHCMRWLGTAERAHDVARRHAASRQSGGQAIGWHQAVGAMLADNEIDLKAAALMNADCAALLDRGEKARHETSLAKVFVSEAVCRVVDRSVQILGGLGVMADTPVENIYRCIRAFRIYDGPSEVHRDVIAKRIMKKTLAEAAEA